MANETTLFSNRKRPARRWRSAVAALMVSTALVACSSPEQRVAKYQASGEKFLEAGDLGRANVEFQNALKIDETHVPSLLGLSRIAEERQDFKSMFGLMQRINRLDPNNLEAIVNLGKFYLIASDETAAMEEADKALAIDAESVDALALKAAVLLKVGDREEAVEFARRATAVDPANQEAVTVLATERALAERPDEAIAEIEKALAVDEEIAVLQLLRIKILSATDRKDEILSSYQNLIRVFPEEASYRRVYAGELIRREDFDGALEQIEAIVGIEPDNLRAKVDVVRLLKTQQGADAARARLLSYVEAEPENTDLKFALAEYYRQEGDVASTRSTLEELAKSKEQAVEFRAQNRIAALYLKDGKKDEARAIVDAILEDDAQNTDALIKRAGLLVDAESYDAAITDLRTALDNNPDATPAMLLMATAFERKGEIAFAEAQFARAIDSETGGPKAANMFAKFLVRHGKADRAEEVLVETLADAPGNLENLKALAALRLGNQDWQGAQEVAEIIEDIDESDVAIDSIRTVASSGLGDYDAVIEALTERGAQAPLESRPLATLVNAYVRSDRTDEAEAMLERIIENDPGVYDERLLMAQVQAAKEDNAAAEAVLLEAVEADPSRAEAFELLYRYYLRSGDRDKANALIDRGLAAAPTNAALQIFKADGHLAAGENEQALALYESLASQRPGDKIVINNYVSLATSLRDDQATLQRALAAAQVLEGDESPFFKDTLGWAYFRNGDAERALPLLKEAAQANQSNAEIQYHLGAVYMASGDVENGRTTLEKAIELGGPDFTYRDDAQNLLNGG